MHFGLAGADIWLEYLAGWFHSSVLVRWVGAFGDLAVRRLPVVSGWLQ